MAKKKLISLDEHNSTSSTLYWGLMRQKPIPNGIACPKCGEELLDTKPNETLTSIPPQKNVGCSSKKCDYTGYRIY
jgi:C4-type Zn-finger protein